MKLNLKEALYKYYILTEGWMENLSEKYSEDVLIFVGRMLQQAYPRENIANHPLAEWLAKTAKSLGEMPWNESNRQKNEDSFQEILAFVKSKDDSKEIINKIKSLSAKDAIKYVEEEVEKPEISGEEELREWLDKGYMKIIGRGPKGSFWVKPLKGEFFGVAQCGSKGSQDIGEFGIGCQRGATGGFGSVGFGRDQHGETYSLLAKSKNGYYTTIISTGADPKTSKFLYHSLQFGNKTIGSENWGDWSTEDFMNAFVDFMIENPYGQKMYKEGETTTNEFGEEVSNLRSLPSRLDKIVENRPIFYKLLKNHPEFVKFYEKQIIKEIGEEEYALLTIGARELFEKDPKRFIEKLPTYLKTEKQEALNILSEINFENFIQNYGEDVVLQNIESILDSMDYSKFETLIKPFINYDKFIKNYDKKSIKEIIRNFAEKSQNIQKTYPIVKNMIESENDFKLIMLNFGNGNIENGIRSFLASLATPRLSKHKDYIKKPEGIFANIKELKRNENGELIDSSNRIIMSNGVVYDEQGSPIDFAGDEGRKNQYIKSRVSYEDKEAEVKSGQWILDYKAIRNLLKDNKDKIIKALGEGKDAEVKFIEFFLHNSSAQERKKELKNIEEDYINYYNNLFDENKSNLPGILMLSKALATERVLGDDKKIFSNMRQMNQIISDNFENKAQYIFAIDKDSLNKEAYNYINKFYYKNSKSSSKIEKYIDTYSAVVDTLKESNFSVIKQLEYAQKTIDNLSKQAEPKQLLRFLYNVSNIIVNSSYLKDFLIENTQNNDIAKKISTLFKKDPRTGVYMPNQEAMSYYKEIKDITNDVDNKNLQEQKIRKYIKNLLEINLKIK